jgi:hypothetical protein
MEDKLMRRVAAGALVAVLFAAPALAALSDIDTDGDMLASFDELVAVYPDLTEETFADLDTNADGFVDEAELTAAIEADLLAAPAQ